MTSVPGSSGEQKVQAPEGLVERSLAECGGLDEGVDQAVFAGFLERVADARRLEHGRKCGWRSLTTR
jgi:hypothetical protein